MNPSKLNITFPLFLFLFTCQSSLAQDHILLRDEFNKAQAFWEVQEGAFSYGESMLFLKQDDMTDRLHYAMEQYLNPREDYTISAHFQLQFSRGNASYGLMWGGKEGLSSYYGFEVNSMGFARAVEVDEGEIRVLHPWTKNRKIKGEGEENILEVRKVGKGAYFYVNGRELFRIDFPQIRGFYQGIILNGACEVAVNAFMIEHPVIEFPQLGGSWPEAVRLHLDSTVNMPFEDESHPKFHPRRMQFFFTREGNIHETHISDSGWTAGMRLDPPFSNSDPNSVVGFFPKESTMVLGSAYSILNSEPLGKGMALSVMIDDSLGSPRNFVAPVLPPQSEPVDWYVSPDRELLLFAAELPGGYGDKDIYLCFKEGIGWSEPMNLGPGVNTFGKEYSPYLDLEKEYLYVGSNGRAGYGKGDIYRLKRLSNSWTKWGTAYNLGGGINTSRWEKDFYPHPREKRTYFMASQHLQRRDFDIYRIKVPIDLEAEPLVKVYGTVYLEGTDKALEGEVQAWRIGGTGFDKDGEAKTSYGRYGMLLPLKEAYQMYALKIGYYPVLDTLDVRPYSSYREIKQDLYLRKLEVGTTITLRQVFFKRGKADLLPESYPELNRLALLMQSMPGLRIEIRGHTDNIGDPNFLQRLSEARAERVRQYLINRRIPGRRMSSLGFGPDQPIAPNSNPITRALNRRVEFLIVGE